MKSKFYLQIIIGLGVFLSLVYYNYLQAQKAIRETKTSPLTIELVSFPETVKSGSQGTFVWKIDSSPDLSTSYTTIYWSYESTPSALTKSDSPLAVGYPNIQPDYTTGVFSLPNNFEVRVRFDKPGRVFFRAYSKVKSDFIWSEEKYLDVVD